MVRFEVPMVAHLTDTSISWNLLSKMHTCYGTNIQRRCYDKKRHVFRVNQIQEIFPKNPAEIFDIEMLN